MSRSIFEQLDATPVTYIVLLAYLGLAFACGLPNPDPELLELYGAANGRLIAGGEPWRLITHCFLHGGLLHVLFNSYALFVLGPTLETFLGSLRFAGLYLCAGIMGGVAAVLYGGLDQWLVGGSGALFGMMGAFLAIKLRSGRTLMEGLQFHGTSQILSMIMINLLIGFLVPFISNSAHIGGLLAGFVVCFMFLHRGRARSDPLTRTLQGGWIALMLSLCAYVIWPVLRLPR